MKRRFWFALSSFCILLLLSIVVYSTEQSLPDTNDKIGCWKDRESTAQTNSSARKGLKTFEQDINTDNSCAPIAAGISQDWFRTKCGLPYKLDDALKIIERLKFLMNTNTGDKRGGTRPGDIYLGLVKFINENLRRDALDIQDSSECFSIEIISCASGLSATDEDGRVIALNDKSNLLRKSDSFVGGRCPTMEDLKRLHGRYADVMLSFVTMNQDGKVLVHAVALDGIEKDDLLVVSNGLKEKYSLVNDSSSFHRGRVVFSPEEGGLDASKTYDPPADTFVIDRVSLVNIIAVVPVKKCAIKCSSAVDQLLKAENDQSSSQSTYAAPEFSLATILLAIIMSLLLFVLSTRKWKVS